MTDPRIRRLRPHLARWFRRRRRDLPWRREPRDPWAVLVSEVMLQQTRVETVAPRFAAFLRRWPTPAAMARSREESVVAAWSGLGYYRRARNLHRAARAIVARHGGRFPRDAASLRALPGVGEYTAGAVGSLALGLSLPVVDGNVARVLSRLFALRGDPRRGAAARRVRDLAASLVPRRGAGAWNEGLMELGALVCVPGRPRCGECPLARDCRARREGLEDRLPEIPRPRRARAVRLAAAVVEDARGRVLLMRRPAEGLLGGLWELPSAEILDGEDPAAALAAELSGRIGGRWTVGTLRARVRHSILDRRIAVEAYGARRAGAPAAGRYVDPKRLEGVALSSMVVKTMRAVVGRKKGQARGA